MRCHLSDGELSAALAVATAREGIRLQAQLPRGASRLRDDAEVQPKLVLINGVPASGKTTLAREWAERHAARLPLCIDIDSIRFMLGGWQNALEEAGLAARDIAIAGIEAHLRNGRDVVVPQYLRRPEFIDRLQATALGQSALFIETALVIDATTADRRFHARAEWGTRGDKHGSLPAAMTTIVREFDDFLGSRPHVIRLASGDDALARLESATTVPRPHQNDR